MATFSVLLRETVSHLPESAKVVGPNEGCKLKQL